MKAIQEEEETSAMSLGFSRAHLGTLLLLCPQRQGTLQVNVSLVAVGVRVTDNE